MTFDTPTDRRGTHSVKWDRMEASYGVSPEDGLAMWVADMDFRVPDCVAERVREIADQGIYAYTSFEPDYSDAIRWWMQTRHGWQVEPEAIFTTTGIVNAVGLCLDTFTAPGDGIVLFTPVYHAFARVIRAAGRRVVECPLVTRDGRYEMDFDAYDAQMTGAETMVILCSPHNPGGRVWTEEELREVAAFCRRHDLILVSDEIHADLVMPGGPRHRVMATVAPEIADRLVTLTAATKTFNIAGAHVGNAIIADETLRAAYAGRMNGLGISPGLFGLPMVTAAYSPEGAGWVDALCRYLDGNRRLFDAGIGVIPGLRSMPLEATYLAWVDFSGTGMADEEVRARVEQGARIAANHGETFGRGGEGFLRFNLATPRSRIETAVARLQAAFGDLQ